MRSWQASKSFGRFVASCIAVNTSSPCNCLRYEKDFQDFTVTYPCHRSSPKDRVNSTCRVGRLRQGIPATMLHGVELYTAQEQGELRRIEPQLLIARSMPRHFVSATLKALVKKCEPVSVPPEQLDPIATPIEEEKQMSVEHVAIEHGLDGRAESIERGTILMPLAARTVRRHQWSRSSIHVIPSAVGPSL